MKRPQEIRHEMLLQLYGSGAIPISLELIRKVAARCGFKYGEQELRDQVHFLIGQNLAQAVTQPATGQTRYQITSQGMLAYEGEEV